MFRVNRGIVLAVVIAMLLFIYQMNAAGEIVQGTEDPTVAPSTGGLQRWGNTSLRCVPSKVALHRPRNVSTTTDAAGNVCCTAVVGDIDLGMTLRHAMARYFCTTKLAGGSIRIMQVGANTGSNSNDHLVQFLKLGVAEAALLEPVPMLFQELSKFHKLNPKIHSLQVAMTVSDGTIDFVAPTRKARGWFSQMGGIKLPPKSFAKAKRMKGYFERINVTGLTYKSVMKRVGWWDSGPLVDVFVVDAEGHDFAIVNMVLDSIRAHSSDLGGRIPIIQYEWRHLSAEQQGTLRERLHQMGYCIARVHYDDLATQPLESDLPCTNSFEMSSQVAS